MITNTLLSITLSIYNSADFLNYSPKIHIPLERAYNALICISDNVSTDSTNEVFKTVGFMDEKYFVYYDDTDFIYRAKTLAYKIIYYPKTIVSHKVRISIGGAESLFSIYYTRRTRFYFIVKNFDFLSKIISFSYFYFTCCIKYLQYGKQERQELIRAILDGWRLTEK